MTYQPQDSPRYWPGKRLNDLARELEERESRQSESIVRLDNLRMNEDQNIVVPGVGELAMNDWSKRQIGTMLGLKFDKYFERASPEEKALQMNLRLARGDSEVKVRVTRDIELGIQADGTLLGLVGPGYQAVSDARLARFLSTSLGSHGAELPVLRSTITSRTTAFFFGVGKQYRTGHSQVGDLFGGLEVVNSGVGFCSLSVYAKIQRLICTNGMKAPVKNAQLLYRRHTGNVDGGIWEPLSQQLHQIPQLIAESARTIISSTNRPVENIEAEVTRILRTTGLSPRLSAAIMAAYYREPNPSAFGVAQALTDARMINEVGLAPEEAHALEDAAGNYLRNN